MHSYWSQLYADFDALHLTDRQHLIYDSMALDDLLYKTTMIRPELFSVKDRPGVKTDFGKQILAAFDLAMPFSLGGMVFCDQAEIKLLHNLSPHALTNHAYRSPYIVVADGAPCAVIKNYGDQSAYALHNRPELGLIAGTYGRLSLRGAKTLARPPRSTSAWKIPLDVFDRFLPARFSTFNVPVEYKQSLVPESSAASIPALGVDHETIVSLAEAALLGADYYEDALASVA